MVGKVVSKVKTGVHKGDSLSEMDRPPSSRLKKELESREGQNLNISPGFIVVPLYKTPEKYLRQLVDTVKLRPIQTGSFVCRTAAEPILPSVSFWNLWLLQMKGLK